jgi:hypothetical protein
MSLENMLLAAIPISGLIYICVLLQKDIRFYKNNDFDYSKISGVPDFWFRLGPLKYVLTPKQRFTIGYPVFFIVLIGLVVLILIAKIGAKT